MITNKSDGGGRDLNPPNWISEGNALYPACALRMQAWVDRTAASTPLAQQATTVQIFLGGLAEYLALSIPAIFIQSGAWINDIDVNGVTYFTRFPPNRFDVSE